MFGLTDTDFEQIKNALIHYPDIEQAIIFGSRAKGNFKPGSDIDLALKGKNITETTLMHLKEELEEKLPLPYFFDLLVYHTISNVQLTQHIDRVGKVIYKKQKMKAQQSLE